MKRKNNYSQAKGFDRITCIYDKMAAIASFNGINKSQLAFLEYLSTHTSCLIIGGGTGLFLQRLLEKNKTIHVTYVDASQKMIQAAQQRISKNLPEKLHQVTFICAEMEPFQMNTYDSIVCNYFLDLFDDTYVDVLVKKINLHLKPDGILYITDFNIPAANNIMQGFTKAGLKVLYWFFKRVAGVSARRLPVIEAIVMHNNFIPLRSMVFLKGILTCNLYRK